MFWVYLGAFLVVAELLLPGLVVVFIGLGALTVAGVLHYYPLISVIPQFLIWFVCSLIYCFTLRLLVIRFYPSDTVKQNIDEDIDMIGQEAVVIEAISAAAPGRISYGDTTWNAISVDKDEISTGERVTIVGRENISWLVKKTPD